MLETNIPFGFLIIRTLQRMVPPQLGEVLNPLPVASCNQVDLDLEGRAASQAPLQPPRQLPPHRRSSRARSFALNTSAACQACHKPSEGVVAYLRGPYTGRDCAAQHMAGVPSRRRRRVSGGDLHTPALARVTRLRRRSSTE